MEELSDPVVGGDEEEETANPSVSGGVVIANGASTVGGYAGDQISVVTTFFAESVGGEVTEMRISGYCSDEMGDDIPWEPFKLTKTNQIVLPLGWSGFTMAVQYRDAQGNLSPIYCDDVNVEGMAKPPDLD